MLVRRFETRVLRPAWFTTVLASIIDAFTRHWSSLVAGVLALYCLGVVGAGLHPMQTARDVSAGPLESAAAIAEERLTSLSSQLALVGVPARSSPSS